MKNNIIYKKGNMLIITIFVIIIVFLLILSSCLLIYFQINGQVYKIKQDIFYVVQNSQMSLNKAELSYSNYQIDENILKNRVNEILKLNNSNLDINIINLDYNQNTNYVYVKLAIKIKPIINNNFINNINITLNESIKLKIMEVK